MSRLLWSGTIQRAFADAWRDWDVMPDEMIEERSRTFTQLWGGVEADAFKRALQEGEAPDRLFALFALGSLAPREVEGLLLPFLHSPLRKERWASAIALAQSKDERVFALLQDLLGEDMEYYSPHAKQNVMRIWSEAVQEARKRFGDSKAWDRLVDPALVVAWKEQEAYDHAYTWHLLHRITVTRLLGDWEDPRAIPALRQTLQRCWEIEHLPPFQSCPSGSLLKDWHHWQDKLAYALGQLGAWNALDGLEALGLPPARFKLARLYLVFGSLGVNLQPMYDGNITLLIHIGTIDPDQVTTILQERFGLDEYVARASLKVFQKWYQERAESRWDD